MTIELTMPALSPTMEEGTVARWLAKEGAAIRPGDIVAEIETDKATMELEAVDTGILTRILVPEGTDGVKVGAVIALVQPQEAGSPEPQVEPGGTLAPPAKETPVIADSPLPVPALPAAVMDRATASSLARRLAMLRGIDLSTLTHKSHGRIVKRDVMPAGGRHDPVPAPTVTRGEVSAASQVLATSDIPHVVEPLTNMRRTIARRLGESKRSVPHIYLTVDVRLDAMLELRAALNAALAPRNVKLSVNDMIVKALALALIEVPACNVRFGEDSVLRFTRVDISVAVSIPGGLVTPVIVGADAKSLSAIAAEIGELAARARAGRLQPHEYAGGTASLSNMGMYGIREFAAVINPPQAMILAIGEGIERSVVDGGVSRVASVMSVTGSFDHRVIDGADAARLLGAFRRLVEHPMELTT